MNQQWTWQWSVAYRRRGSCEPFLYCPPELGKQAAVSRVAALKQQGMQARIVCRRP